jgi:hypothetical protein
MINDGSKQYKFIATLDIISTIFLGLLFVRFIINLLLLMFEKSYDIMDLLALSIPTWIFTALSLIHIITIRVKTSRIQPKYEFVNQEECIDFFAVRPDKEKAYYPLILSASHILLFLALINEVIKYGIFYPQDFRSTHTVGLSMYNLIMSFLFFISYRFRYLSLVKFWNGFPCSFLEITPLNQLNLITKYSDYENKILDDDKPELKVGQKFIVKTREFARNETETNEVLILNQISAKKTALVTIIEHSGLANELRKGDKLLVAELVAIHEYMQLEIALRLEPK